MQNKMKRLLGTSLASAMALGIMSQSLPVMNMQAEELPVVNIQKNRDISFELLQGALPIKDIFPDKALAKAVTYSVGKPTVDDIVSLAELEAAHGLDAWGSEGSRIKDLSGIEYLKNIRWLNVPDNNLHDLGPIATLTNLDIVNFSNNNISDISPLSNLKNLQMIEMDDNQVRDISPLANLQELRHLRAMHNLIDDVSVFNELPIWTSANLSYNRVSDISSLNREAALGVSLGEQEFVKKVKYADVISVHNDLRGFDGEILNHDEEAGVYFYFSNDGVYNEPNFIWDLPSEESVSELTVYWYNANNVYFSGKYTIEIEY